MNIDFMRKVNELDYRLDSQPKPEISLVLISESVLAGAVASVTFSSIPQNFKSLILQFQLRSSATAEVDINLVRFNADTGANYDHISVQFQSVGTSIAVSRAATSIRAGICEAANSRASNWSPTAIIIPGYSKADREKWLQQFSSAAFGNVSADTDLLIWLNAGRWRSANAITSITVLPNTGPNYVADGILQLYGLA